MQKQYATLGLKFDLPTRPLRNSPLRARTETLRYDPESSRRGASFPHGPRAVGARFWWVVWKHCKLLVNKPVWTEHGTKQRNAAQNETSWFSEARWGVQVAAMSACNGKLEAQGSPRLLKRRRDAHNSLIRIWSETWALPAGSVQPTRALHWGFVLLHMSWSINSQKVNKSQKIMKHAKSKFSKYNIFELFVATRRSNAIKIGSSVKFCADSSSGEVQGALESSGEAKLHRL